MTNLIFKSNIGVCVFVCLHSQNKECIQVYCSSWANASCQGHYVSLYLTICCNNCMCMGIMFEKSPF